MEKDFKKRLEKILSKEPSRWREEAEVRRVVRKSLKDNDLLDVNLQLSKNIQKCIYQILKHYKIK